MTIMTIMVAIIAPSLRGFAIGRRTNNAANAIVSLSNFARAQSASESRRYRLNIDASNRAAWLTYEDDNGNFVGSNNDNAQRYEADPGVTMRTDLSQQADGVYVEFKPTGRCDPASVEFMDAIGNDIVVSCQSPTELFHILPSGAAVRR